jgi:hypothetical protein
MVIAAAPKKRRRSRLILSATWFVSIAQAPSMLVALSSMRRATRTRNNIAATAEEIIPHFRERKQASATTEP